MNYFLNSATVILTCLTPIHIGSQDKYTQADYIVTGDSKTILILDDIKWFLFLKQHALVNSYKEDLLDSRFNLTRWVRQKGLNDSDLVHLVKYKINISCDEGDNRNSFNDIAACMRLSDGRPYIPGSSIKGAIRTMLVNSLLRHKQLNTPNNFTKEIIDSNTVYRPGDNQARRSINKITKNIEKRLVANKDSYSVDASVVNTLMKNIRVSDAILIGDIETALFQKCDVSYSNKANRHLVRGLPIWRECLPVGTKLAFTLTFDNQAEALGLVNSMEDLIERLYEQTQNLLQLEDTNLPFDTSEFRCGIESEANLMIGGGTGFTSKSLVNELVRNSKEAAKVVNNVLNNNFFRTRKKYCRAGQTIAPETLKVVQIKPNQYVEMGLCKLEIK